MKKEVNKNTISISNKILLVVLVVVVLLVALNFISGKTITGRAITNLNCGTLEQGYYFSGVVLSVSNQGTGDSGKQACLSWCNSKTEGKSCWWYARDGGCLIGSNERIPYPNPGDPNIPYSYAGNCVSGATQPNTSVTINSIIPTFGLPGSNVTILGTNFIGVTSVSFIKNSVSTPSSFGVKNSTEISTIVPSSLTPSIYNIDVITLNNGKATRYNAFNVINTSTFNICKDSDVTEEYPDGKNYYLNGTTTQGVISVTDYCYGSDGNTLFENYCNESGTLVQNLNYKCPNGCKDGACNVITLPTVINGVCGSSNGGTFTTAPTTNLCLQGTASSVTTNTNTYTWACQGSNGGTTASCSAIRSSTPTLKCNPLQSGYWWDYTNYNNVEYGRISAGTGETGKQKCLNWCNSLAKAGVCSWYSSTGACSLHSGKLLSKPGVNVYYASVCAVQ